LSPPSSMISEMYIVLAACCFIDQNSRDVLKPAG
jgi:hypothetical protein